MATIVVCVQLLWCVVVELGYKVNIKCIIGIFLGN